MYNDDDEEDEASSYRNKSRVKWSSPTVQNQRMAYMSKLGHQKREHLVHDTDRFSERFSISNFSSVVKVNSFRFSLVFGAKQVQN